VAVCADCRRREEVAIRIASELRSLPPQACPETIVRSVLRQVRPKRKRLAKPIRPFHVHLRPRLLWVPAFGLIALLLSLVAFELYPPSRWLQGGEPHYTDEEIAQAQKGILLAFGYVHYATSRTHHILEDEVVPERVIGPLKRSLDTIEPTQRKGERS